MHILKRGPRSYDYNLPNFRRGRTIPFHAVDGFEVTMWSRRFTSEGSKTAA